MAKAYKNVYTIFEKVKKGELESTGPSLFSNISYNLKNEIVKPYLHYIDEKALRKSVDRHILYGNPSKLIASVPMSKGTPQELQKQMQDIYRKFPKEVMNDIFNMYYHDVENLDFEQRTAQNKFRYKVIEKANNPVSKVMSKSSHLKSMVFTRSYMEYYLLMLAMLEQQDKQAFDDLMDQMQQKKDGQGQGKPQPGGTPMPGQPDPNQNGDGDGDPQQQEDSNTPPPQGNQQSSGKSSKGQNNTPSLEDVVNKMENSRVNEKLLEKAMEQAKETSQMLDSVMTQEEMDDAWDKLSGTYERGIDQALEKTDMDYLRRIENQLKEIGFNMNNIKNRIKSLLDRSVSYFSARETPIYESLFDADSMDGIMDYELFHPKLRKICLEDIMVKDTKKMGKIDIYVDMSGSMNSSCGIRKEDGRNVTKETFAKAFALKMKELNLLNQVYSFQSRVKFEGESMINILSMRGGGSTDLDEVIRCIRKNQRNAIVLTDAEDRCYEYSEHAFFIGVEGSRFNDFGNETLKRYQENNQLCVFDGTRVYSVNENGYVIN